MVSLAVGGLSIATPQAPTVPTVQLFTEVAKAFKWDDKVMKHVLEKLKVESLEEFVLMFPNPEMIEERLVKKVTDLAEGDHLLQAARVRRAVDARKAAMEHKGVTNGRPSCVFERFKCSDAHER